MTTAAGQQIPNQKAKSDFLRGGGCLAFALTLLAIVSCGYRPVRGQVPGGGGEVCVPPVENRTSYPGLTAQLTYSLRKRLARSGIDVKMKGEGAPNLKVTIAEVEGGPGMVQAENGGLVPLERIWKIKAEAKLVRPGGKEIFGAESFEVSARSYTGDNPLAEESLGQRGLLALLDELSDEIAVRIFERPGRREATGPGRSGIERGF